MAGDLHAQLASGEVGAQRLTTLCARSRSRRHRGASPTRSSSAPRRPPARASVRLPAGTYASSAILDLADGSRIDIVCAVHVDPERRRDHRRLRGHLARQPMGHQRRQELHPRLHHVHGPLGAQPRHPQQPRQPRPDQGRGARGLDRQRRAARSRAPPATSSACSCRTRCSRRSPRSAPTTRWPRDRARCGRCRSTATTTTAAPFITAMFTYAGGVGARAAKPGLDACSYPTGVSAVPIEVVEASAPIRFHEKSLRRGSGGAGRQTRRARSGRRVLGRHRQAVAAQRRHQSARRAAPGRVRRRGRGRPAASRSTASRS